MKTTPIKDWVKITVDWYKNNDIPDSNGYEKRDYEINLCRKWQSAYTDFTTQALKN